MSVLIREGAIFSQIYWILRYFSSDKEVMFLCSLNFVCAFVRVYTVQTWLHRSLL